MSTNNNSLFGYAQSLASYALQPFFSSASSNKTHEAALQKLVSIGVPQNDAVRALDATRGDLKEAARMLSDDLKRESKKRAVQHKRRQEMKKKQLKDPHKMVHRRAQRENQKFKRHNMDMSRKLAVAKKKSMKKGPRVRFEETDCFNETNENKQDVLSRSLARSSNFRRGTPMPKKRAHLEVIDDDYDATDDMDMQLLRGSDDSDEDLAIMNVISHDDEVHYSSDHSGEDGIGGEKWAKSASRATRHHSGAKKTQSKHVATSTMSTHLRNTAKPIQTRQRSVANPDTNTLASLPSSSTNRGAAVPNRQKLHMFTLISRVAKKPDALVPLARAVDELATKFAASPVQILPRLERLGEKHTEGAAGELLKLLYTYPTLLPAAAKQLAEKVEHVHG